MLQFVLNTSELCNRIPIIDFIRQINRAMKMFNLMSVWKLQYFEFKDCIVHNLERTLRKISTYDFV